MVEQFITPYNLNNGVFMIGVFVLFCIVLAGLVLAMVLGGDKEDRI
jgi:hypothetical protein